MSRKEHHEDCTKTLFCKLMKIDEDKVFKETPPKPDYVLKDKKVIGIEITEYIDEKLKKEFDIKKEICKSVQKELNNKLNNNVNIKISWRKVDGKLPFENLKRETLKNEILKEIIKFTPEDNNAINLATLENRSERIYQNKILRGFVQDIRIRRYDNIFTKTKVSFDEAKFLGVSEEIILDRISKKEVKIKNYKQYYSENWLIIPIFSEWFYNEVDEDALEEIVEKKVFNSSFNAVFIIDIQNEKVFMLKLKH